LNLMMRNQDDHTKNIAFLMDRRGEWRLSPAYDVTYAYNPNGAWTNRHQMSVNGKRDGFTHEDIMAAATAADVRPRRAREILSEVGEAVARWPEFAALAGVPESLAQVMLSTFRQLGPVR
jgi:serine/threonine-protein kinase HipA